MDNVTQEQYPGLAGLDFARRWMDGFTAVFENLLVSLSSILLTIGIGVSMFDFFTGGSALQNGYLMNGWATIQTLAVDTQFIVMWYRCKLAIRNRNYIAAIGYGLLGSALGFVVFATNAIPSLQLATHQNFNSAITTLGFDAASIVWIRSAVLVVLAIIAAFNRTVITFSQDGTKTDVQELVKVEKVRKPKAKKVALPKVRKLWKFPVFWTKKNKVENVPENASTEQNVPAVVALGDHVTELPQKPKAKVTQPLTEPSPDTQNSSVERDTEPLKFARKRRSVNVHKTAKRTQRVRGTGEEQIKKILSEKPSVTNAEICRSTGLSASYVSTTRKQLEEVSA